MLVTDTLFGISSRGLHFILTAVSAGKVVGNPRPL